MSDLDQSRKDNHATYEGFLGLTKWGIIFVVLVLIGLALFLV